jgi:hypothetical protein
MRRRSGVLAIAAVIVWLGRAAAETPSEPLPETQRSFVLRAVYFPFLALGHGLMLLAQYGIGYPIYYVAKPAYDFLYESSEDPTKIRIPPQSPDS